MSLIITFKIRVHGKYVKSKMVNIAEHIVSLNSIGKLLKRKSFLRIHNYFFFKSGEAVYFAIFPSVI